MPIHPTAIISKEAEISASATIGPYAIIEGHVKIGNGVKVYPHAYISGWTEIGDECEIHPCAIIGHLPQDLGFKGERSYCKVGARSILREGVTVHRGTQPESWTILGENCFLFSNAHVAHNCEIGNNVKIYSNTVIGGHAIIHDNAIISGMVSYHQFARVGEFAMIGGGARVTKDIPPYMKVLGEAICMSYNAIGLRRSGQFTSEEINDVRQAFRTLYHSGLPMNKAIQQYRIESSTRAGQRILDFLQAPTKLGLAGGRRRATHTSDIVSGAVEEAVSES